jgi:DNA-binding beta-propeller fold protein YncE
LTGGAETAVATAPAADEIPETPPVTEPAAAETPDTSSAVESSVSPPELKHDSHGALDFGSRLSAVSVSDPASTTGDQGASSGMGATVSGGDAIDSHPPVKVNPVIATIDVGDAPAGVAVSPDGATAYVANSLDGTLAYVTNQADDTVSVISL